MMFMLRILLRRLLLALLLAPLTASPAWGDEAPATNAPAGKKFALLVGVRTYGHSKLPDLQYTENDVEDLARLLQKKPAGWARVRLLTSTRGKKRAADRPTVKNIRAALKALLAGRTKHDTVLVALAGHGVQFKPKGKDKEEAFFCPGDAQVSDPATLISLAELFKQLDDSGARVKLLLVDACRNDPAAGRNLDVDNVPRPPHGIGALFSCASGQRAFETAKLGKKGHGVFFHFVLKGLEGAAMNEESEVTWDRLTEYVKTQVSRTVPKVIGGGAKQEPQQVANLTGEPPVLALLEGVRRTVTAEERKGVHIGLCVEPLPPAQARRLKLAGPAGLRVTWAIPDRPAARAGLHVGDVILAVDRKKVSNWQQYSGLLRKHKPGDTAEVQVLRGGRRPRFKVTLQAILGDDKMLEVYRAFADKNVSVAQYRLGMAYLAGRGVPASSKDAVVWFRKAAQRGHGWAQWMLARMYSSGRGVPPNNKMAARWYRQAAGYGILEAQFQYAQMCLSGRGTPPDDSEAFKWFRQAAEQDHVPSAFQLAILYSNGRGVPRNDAEGVKWFRKAAEKGHPAACKDLGLRYAQGRGVKRDDTEAVKWYRKAAQKNNAQAQNNLGVMYQRGRGVPRNDVEAARWYQQAADKGERMAQFNLASLYEQGRGVTRDFGQAARWYRKAADKGEAQAQRKLGELYLRGRGVGRSEVTARTWYGRAARKGDPEAQYQVGLMAEEGRGGQAHDDSKARQWYQKAAEQRHTAAQYKLGLFWKNGRGGPRKYKEARLWFWRAATKNHGLAMLQLGDLCARGRGGPKNLAEARKWYQKAAKQGVKQANERLKNLAAKPKRKK
jgi:TPR repeat protein/uncharacterized caspase-like protein